MTPRRFSIHQLRYLRNQIPIQSVIPSVNGADAQHLRFDCPICGDRDTAVNKNTNLARCFGCQKNFNPIEMVMAAHQLSFVDAVYLLLDQRQQPPKKVAGHQPVASNHASAPLAPSTTNGGRPTALGDILPSALDAFRYPLSPKECCDGCKRLEKSLATIQHRLSQIERLVVRLNLTSTE
jgi:hypothetical protein